jgi:hypothetical protein
MRDPLAVSTLTAVFLRQKIGIVLLEASRSMLCEKREAIAKIDYPFVLMKAFEGDRFMACKLSACFAESPDLDRVIEAIEKEKPKIGIEQKSSWRRK